MRGIVGKCTAKAFELFEKFWPVTFWSSDGPGDDLKYRIVYIVLRSSSFTFTFTHCVHASCEEGIFEEVYGIRKITSYYLC
jgi:hypothetical protein